MDGMSDYNNDGDKNKGDNFIELYSYPTSVILDMSYYFIITYTDGSTYKLQLYNLYIPADGATALFSSLYICEMDRTMSNITLYHNDIAIDSVSGFNTITTGASYARQLDGSWDMSLVPTPGELNW